MKAVELFAGIGGFRLGLERNGIDVIWSNEWDKYAATVYDKNFTEGKIDRRSITDVPANEIPPHDLLCGGFPCQAFSIAGKRRGFSETRGTLFFEIMRIARHHRTPYLLLENVKGLLSHDGGRTFEVIIKTLDESGYDCQWQVLNSKNFGVPQNRERIYIVGHLRGYPRPEVFPITKDGSLATYTRSEEEAEVEISNTIRAKAGGGRGDIEDSYVVAHTLTSSTGGPDANDTYVAESFDLKANGSSTRRGTVKSGYTGTLDTTGNHGTHQNGRYRRLTPIEYERLQGFPDNWTTGVSDTQRYKQCGNAVTVNVVDAVAQRIVNSI